MRLIERALKAVNKIRVETLHVKPLKRLKKGIYGVPWGWPSDAWRCPIAVSLTTKDFSCSVGDKEIYLRATEDDIVIPTPTAIKNFIRNFDSGKFPEYEAGWN